MVATHGRNRSARFQLCLALAAWQPGMARAQADVQFLGAASIPGDATDKSGLTDILPDGTPHNRLGSHGSGIAYTGDRNQYLMVADRGPRDGTVPFQCRLHRFEITVSPGTTPVIRPTLLATTLLKTEAGEPFIGITSAFDAKHPSKSLRFDPEGIRMSRTGTVFISDEYGPFLYEFGLDGKRLRTMVLFAPARHALAKRGRVPLAALAGQELVLRERGSITREVLEQAMAAGDMRASQRPPSLHSSTSLRARKKHRPKLSLSRPKRRKR